MNNLACSCWSDGFFEFESSLTSAEMAQVGLENTSHPEDFGVEFEG